MANWCYNTVQFDCDARTMKKLETLFGKLAKREQMDGCGQLPDFSKQQDGWLFSIRWEDDTLYYETQWSPNIGVMREIADHFGAGFIHEYEESNMWIFGRAIYQEGVLTEIGLDDSDFDQYDCDEETGIYLFEGREYENSYEILETLLDRKQQSISTQQKMI